MLDVDFDLEAVLFVDQFGHFEIIVRGPLQMLQLL
jgi:hypothetical protein